MEMRIFCYHVVNFTNFEPAYQNINLITNETQVLDAQFSSFGTQVKPKWPSYEPILFIIDPFSLFRLQ